MDPVEISKALMRCPSVTPEEAGALSFCEETLTKIGFACHRETFREAGAHDTENMYARWGKEGKNLCFAGHVDVVAPGSGWTHDPFDPIVKDGMLYGRGASDMKAAIACFMVAAGRYLKSHTPKGSISLLLTCDEEGPAVNGTKKMLDWMKARGEKIDACIVGEPTNPTTLGEMVKVGRRGSIYFDLTLNGKQGHSAYPDQAQNPITPLIEILHRMATHVLDEGTPYFQPSNLQVTSIDVGNVSGNVIPGSARAKINIRFNDLHTRESLEAWVAEVIKPYKDRITLASRCTAGPFLSTPGDFCNLVCNTVEEVTGRMPARTTTGGSSDARFIIHHTKEIVECGLINATAHMADEHVPVKEIEELAEIYFKIIKSYFE